MTFKYPYLKIIFDILSVIKSNIGLIVIVYVLNFSNESTFMFWAKIVVGGFLIVALIEKMIETFLTRVEFTADGARMYTGLFSKSERYIPRDKFENVQTEATLLHRLFKAQKITLETGEASGDITLVFVKAQHIEKMQAYVLSHHEEQTIMLQQEDAKTTLFSPTIKDILKAAIASFSFLAIIPIAINAWSDFRIGKFVETSDVEIPLWLTLLLLFLAILAALVIGLLQTFNSYYKYSISMDDERIYVQKGWLSKQSFSVRKARVQAVVYKQSFYQRMLRVTTIKLISTGEVAEIKDLQINELFPYLPTKKADELVAQMLPQYTRQQMLHRASPRARKLIWLRPPLFAIVVAICGLWHWGFYVGAGILFIFTYISRILTYKNLAFTFEGPLAQVRSGGLSIETIVTKRPKLIEIELTSTVLQRKVNAMSMTLANRAQPVYTTELQDIDEQLKEELLMWFEERAGEIKMDPKTEDGALKKIAIEKLVTLLARSK